MPIERTRLNYRAGGLLTADDYKRAQAYDLDTQAIRCRSLHTWGIATGLEVAGEDGVPAVSVSAGMAVDSLGRQIVLGEPALVDLSHVFTPQVYLTIASDSEYADWRIFPKGSGYTRIVDAPALRLGPNPPDDDGLTLVLARLDFTPEWRLRPPSLSERRYCGLDVGSLGFPGPGFDASRWPKAGIVEQGGALTIASPSTDVFGSVQVEGRVSVGLPAGASAAALVVQAATPQLGEGRISNDGQLVYGNAAGPFADVQSGDYLHVLVDASSDPLQLKVAEIFGGQAVSVASPPTTSFRNASYLISRSMVARVQTGELDLALVVAADGNVGIGGQPGSSRLKVTAGDIQLDQNQVVRFLGNGSLQARAPAHAVNFIASASTLELRETGDILFFVGDRGLQATPAMIASRDGNVGIGVADPAEKLTVNGPIRSEGLKFPDGSIQTAAVVPIPVGTVVDWWRPDSSTSWGGEGFQLCDGSTITDPASPLVGQKTPDLRQRFVAGVVSYEQIGGTGGADTHTHSYSFGQHTHGMNHIHQVQGNTGPPEQTAGDRIAGSSISNSGHTHTIDVNSSSPSPAATGWNTPMSGETTDAASNLPPYMELLKVMRIK